MPLTRLGLVLKKAYDYSACAIMSRSIFRYVLEGRVAAKAVPPL